MSDAVNAQTGEVLTQSEAEEYAKIDRVFKKYEPRKAELNAKIKRIFTSKGTRVVGPVIIKIVERVLTDKKSAEAKYPISRYPQFYEQKWVFNYDALSAKQKKPFETGGLALTVDVAAEYETADAA